MQYMLLTGNFDKEMVLIHSILRRKRRFIDIGANQGIYSLYFSKIFSNVNSFEPIEEVTNLLKITNKRNIEIHNLGLSDKQEIMDIQIPISEKKFIISQSSFNYCGKLPSIKRSITVSNLDYYNFSDVDLIKIDVEGHEDFVFKGAFKTITRCKPILLIEIELRHRNNPISDLVEKVVSLDYKCFFYKKQKLVPFDFFNKETDQNPELLKNVLQSKCLYINNFIFIPNRA